MTGMERAAAYSRVFLTFARNSLVRDLTFRGNFIVDSISSLAWVIPQAILYMQMYRFTKTIGDDPGWSLYQFYAFFATGLVMNATMQAFFMTNIDELTDLIRTGGLDFILLKPIDTQFLISLRRIDWSSLVNLVTGLGILIYSLAQLGFVPGVVQVVLYVVYLFCGIAIYYSLMITLGASTVWMGRNLTLYDFWFYIITFSRYPMEIYTGRYGVPLRAAFTFAIPVLIVVNVPARMIVWPLEKQQWWLAGFALLATAACLAASRWVFHAALASYRSAS
jgi:ABC-2 type transport system permease protein